MGKENERTMTTRERGRKNKRLQIAKEDESNRENWIERFTKHGKHVM